MAPPMAELESEEVDLCGNWLVQKDRSVIGDATEQRIQWLTTEKLDASQMISSGWETLYRDPRDGRLWELTYPQSEMHGGGPRRLHVLSRDEAAAKYEHAAISPILTFLIKVKVCSSAGPFSIGHVFRLGVKGGASLAQ